jgi:hypothetical protein
MDWWAVMDNNKIIFKLDVAQLQNACLNMKGRFLTTKELKEAKRIAKILLKDKEDEIILFAVLEACSDR